MALDAYKWLVVYLLQESAHKLQSALSAGKDPFTARNDSQVYYCRSLALAYIQVGLSDVYGHLERMQILAEYSTGLQACEVRGNYYRYFKKTRVVFVAYIITFLIVRKKKKKGVKATESCFDHTHMCAAKMSSPYKIGHCIQILWCIRWGLDTMITG